MSWEIPKLQFLETTNLERIPNRDLCNPPIIPVVLFWETPKSLSNQGSYKDSQLMGLYIEGGTTSKAGEDARRLTNATYEL